MAVLALSDVSRIANRNPIKLRHIMARGMTEGGDTFRFSLLRVCVHTE